MEILVLLFIVAVWFIFKNESARGKGQGKINFSSQAKTILQDINQKITEQQRRVQAQNQTESQSIWTSAGTNPAPKPQVKHHSDTGYVYQSDHDARTQAIASLPKEIREILKYNRKSGEV